MPKIFNIYVPDDTLVSRIISSQSQVTELYVIDRADRKFISEHSEELNKPALYILVNRDKRQLYVGETGDSLKRLRNHEAKDFWTEAIVFHSTSNTLSQTEVSWLEAKTYKTLKELGYYDLSENKKAPQEPTLIRYQEITLEGIFEEAKNYICAAGFDIFLKKLERDASPQSEPVEKVPARQGQVWLIPSSEKRFDLQSCFAEYGEVYWQRTDNMLSISKGDRGYIYGSDPDKAILYSFEVLESPLPYSKQMDRDDKFTKVKGRSNKDWGARGKDFTLIKLTGIAKGKHLSYLILLKNGLKGSIRGAMIISQEKYKTLLDFIDANFDNTSYNDNPPKNPRLEITTILPRYVSVLKGPLIRGQMAELNLGNDISSVTDIKQLSQLRKNVKTIEKRDKIHNTYSCAISRYIKYINAGYSFKDMEDDAMPIDVTKKKHQASKMQKAKSPRRPPFKFSMANLKPGDTVVFAPTQREVKIISDKEIEYDNNIYTLSGFCKAFMPEEGSENKEYQGPSKFTYHGKTLDAIRKEQGN